MIRKSPTILLVEDDVENRNAMAKILQSAAYDVVEMDNGQSALGHILENDIDILVTDLRLPVMDGVELLKRLRKAQTISSRNPSRRPNSCGPLRRLPKDSTYREKIVNSGPN